MDEREAMIRAILDQAVSLLSEKEREEVLAFVDAGEYGVAVETLCDIIREEGKVVPIALAEELRALGLRMGMELSTFDGIDEGGS